VAFRNLVNVAPFISLGLAGSRLVKETVAVFEATDKNELVLAIASDLNDGGTHTAFWHFRDLLALFESHVWLEGKQAALLNKRLVCQLECQVGPLVQHVEELEIDFTEAELFFIRLGHF